MLKKSAGFTLIEIMIVMAIVASLMVIAIPKISPLDRLRTAVRRLTVITRETQTNARLKSSIYRLVFEMPEDEKKSHAFYIEQASKKDVQLAASNEDDKNKKEDETTTETGFAMDTKVTKKPEELPSGFFFEDIQFSEKQKITTGKAYVYFYPQGFVTKALIHITDRKKIHWTIVLNPLTGYGTVLSEYKTFGDLQ